MSYGVSDRASAGSHLGALIDAGADDLPDRQHELPRSHDNTADGTRADFAEIQRHGVRNLADACAMSRDHVFIARTHAEHEPSADTERSAESWAIAAVLYCEGQLQGRADRQTVDTARRCELNASAYRDQRAGSAERAASSEA